MQHFELAKTIFLSKCFNLMYFTTDFYLDLTNAFQYEINMLDFLRGRNDLLFRMTNFCGHMILNDIIKHNDFTLIIRMKLKIIYCLEHF
jgi:hypothetical protein